MKSEVAASRVHIDCDGSCGPPGIALVVMYILGLPLTFVVQAMFAKLVQLVSGASLETSIVFAVKCADAMLPPLVAIPVFALVWQWTRRSLKTGTPQEEAHRL